MAGNLLRARDLGIAPGIFSVGSLNAITDVSGLGVGQVTLRQDPAICTGVTTVLPHGGNLYQEKVPAGLAVGNGYGKLAGATQIDELGEIETPILLTNTLAVPAAASACIAWTLDQPGNEAVNSVNPIVGETNDGFLNNIRLRLPDQETMRQAIESARPGPVEEGCAGAGTGTIAFGWKGGIGTSSRVLPEALGGFTLGALVQTNFGGVLQILGVPVGVRLRRYAYQEFLNQGDGSIMIVIATDAPLSDRNLKRLARRGLGGLARTGASFSNGSGDYALAFSTNEAVRRTTERRSRVSTALDLPNDFVSPLFQAAIEAVEEAIYNSMFMAETTSGYRGVVEALPVAQVLEILRRPVLDK